MRLAALFWFYADFDVCENRLRLLRLFNPGLPIYGLYGGSAEDVEEARRRLGPLLDDFYAYGGTEPAAWKWRHGDRVIAAWARERGRLLTWDTVVVVQWDLLVLRPLTALFARLQPGQALFSGDRPAAEVRGWWGWLKGEDPEKRVEAEGFERWLRDACGYEDDLWCCLFILAALPREYLERYAALEQPEHGFLEYKMPTLARVWSTPVLRDPNFDPWWAADPSTRAAPRAERVLNAVGQDVSTSTVLEQLARADGRRLFHPYREVFPLDEAAPAARQEAP
jgi:hypothetical protein